MAMEPVEATKEADRETCINLFSFISLVTFSRFRTTNDFEV